MDSFNPMPPTAKKIPFYGRRRTPRTTTGCLTCRQRRLKCDETKPVCTRCTHLDLDCTYRVQIRWPTEGAKLGNNRIRGSRRKNESSSPNRVQPVCSGSGSPPPSIPDKALNFLSDELRRDIHGSDISSPSLTRTPTLSARDCRRDEEKEILGLKIIPDSSRKGRYSVPHLPDERTFFVRSLDYSLPRMSNEDRLLFDFYACKMCPRCMVRNGNNNNYRQVVLPLVYQSHLLLKTVLAVAANRLKLHNGGFQTVALRYQNLALKGLQQSIITKNRTWFSRIEILSVILMLCFFEIYDPSPGPTDQNGLRVRPWVTHSQGIRHLLEEDTFADSQDTQYEQAILSFHSQYFVSRSILTYTTMLPHEDHEGILQSAFYWLKMADRPKNEINPFAGCSNELLMLILGITYQLRCRKFLVDPHSDFYKGWANRTRRQLLCIVQYSPKDATSDIFGNLSNHNWNNTCSGASVDQTAECFRLAALILLENIPDGQSQSRASEYISQLFQLLQSGIYIPPSGKLGSSSYFWPCFIAGCHIRCPQQQASMLGHLTRLTSDRPCMQSSNIVAQQIQNLLVHIWAIMKDYNLTSVLIDDGSVTASFVWENVNLLGKCAFEWV